MSTEDFDLSPLQFNGQDFDGKAAEKFNQFISLNVNDKTESKNGLTYLSWSNAWLEFKKVYPTATYNVIKNPQTGLPFFTDAAMGIMVFTEVDAGGLKYTMWLPVMDSSNRAMKTEAYTYPVWDKVNRKQIDRKVEAATMTDINKAIMRCLTKNLSMYGLGLYLYGGEDMPENATDTENTVPDVQQVKTPRKRKAANGKDRYDGIRQAINAARTTQDLVVLYQQHENEVKSNPQIMALFTERKQQLLKAA